MGWGKVEGFEPGSAGGQGSISTQEIKEGKRLTAEEAQEHINRGGKVVEHAPVQPTNEYGPAKKQIPAYVNGNQVGTAKPSIPPASNPQGVKVGGASCACSDNNAKPAAGKKTVNQEVDDTAKGPGEAVPCWKNDRGPTGNKGFMVPVPNMDVMPFQGKAVPGVPMPFHRWQAVPSVPAPFHGEVVPGTPMPNGPGPRGHYLLVDPPIFVPEGKGWKDSQ